LEESWACEGRYRYAYIANNDYRSDRAHNANMDVNGQAERVG
jgi:hypothetical protein